jgi:hypothetical protein
MKNWIKIPLASVSKGHTFYTIYIKTWSKWTWNGLDLPGDGPLLQGDNATADFFASNLRLVDGNDC